MELLKWFYVTITFYQFIEGIYADSTQQLDEFDIDSKFLPFIEKFPLLCSPKNLTKFITFHHYCKNSSKTSTEIEINNTQSLRNWLNGAPVRIFIHGFRNSKDSISSTSIRNAYLDFDEYNIIIVDWNELSDTFCYRRCVIKIDEIGKAVADLIIFLQQSKSVKTEDIYLIGHSLGAHAAGAAGKHFSLLSNGKKLPVIFALDPAGPLFRNVSNDEEIDKSDAEYVEVIHTDAKNGYGIHLALGHADFFVNGGENQPGCFGSNIGIIIPEFIPKFWSGLTQLFNICSHEKAHILFAESVRLSLMQRHFKNSTNIGFFGYKCDSVKSAFNKTCLKPNTSKELQRMGGEPYSVKNGIFYVSTI